MIEKRLVLWYSSYSRNKQALFAVLRRLCYHRVK